MSLNRSSQFLYIEAYKETVRKVTARNSLRSVLRHGRPQTLVPPIATAVSLQGGLGAHMEEPHGNSTWRIPSYFQHIPSYFSHIFHIFLHIFHIFLFYMFFTYSFIFPTYLFIFPSYFPHIPSYFPHISHTVRRATARQGPPQTLVPSRVTAVSLQGGLGAHMEETVEEWHLAPHFAQRFANRLWSKKVEAQTFFKSQSLYRGGLGVEFF